MVLDSGDGVTHTCPVTNGIVMNHAVMSNHIAGRKMTGLLNDLLARVGHSHTAYSTNVSEWKDTVATIKSKVGWVSQNYKDDCDKAKNGDKAINRDYELPNKKVITLGKELFECGESMFNPESLGGGE